MATIQAESCALEVGLGFAGGGSRLGRQRSTQKERREFASRLRERKAAVGSPTNAQIARKAKISERTLDHYLSGDIAVPQFAVVARLAKVLDTTPEYLTGLESSVQDQLDEIRAEVEKLRREVAKLGKPRNSRKKRRAG